MTIADPDVFAVAQSLLRRYGDEAKRHALQRTSELLEDGDLDGRSLLMQVADAIDELRLGSERRTAQNPA